jgi:site-specific DNA-methyltransferase (adenine-specific)
MTDVWDINFLSTTAVERTGYPTQKPLTLLTRVIELFSNEGDVVLDAFCGSGTTGVAAAALSRHCVMLDINPTAASIAEQRMLNQQAPPSLFD